MVKITTIQLERPTAKKLRELKEYPRETYDSVINKLIVVGEIKK